VVNQKEMKYLYAILTRTGLATMDNDAKSCYDRIICNLAMIVSQYFGVSARAAKMQATTLQKFASVFERQWVTRKTSINT
jgi:rhamnose utilization protein RhaD (predicted bifunctional aldolase and dehydrogenase)